MNPSKNDVKKYNSLSIFLNLVGLLSALYTSSYYFFLFKSDLDLKTISETESWAGWDGIS